MTRKRFAFGIETRCGLSVAAHAAMCADATLTPDQAINIAHHDAMEEHDQLMAYAVTAGIDTLVVVDMGELLREPCRRFDVSAMLRERDSIAGRDMFKSLEDRVLIRAVADEPSRIQPGREPKKRDWEQRSRKRRRR